LPSGSRASETIKVDTSNFGSVDFEGLVNAASSHVL